MSETLERALSYIDTPEKWTIGMRGVTENGDWVEGSHPQAVRFCALGAIDRVVGEEMLVETPASIALAEQLPKDFYTGHMIATNGRVAQFNNSSNYETVRAWFQRAIRTAKEREAVAVDVPVSEPVMAYA